VLGKEILDIRSMPSIEGVDTITLYLRAELQAAWQDYLLSLHPKRIIFNPGTENIEFENRAESIGIETIEACTLVMLRTNQF
jgi:predicted CoA-binding protein